MQLPLYKILYFVSNFVQMSYLLVQQTINNPDVDIFLPHSFIKLQIVKNIMIKIRII